MQEMRAMFRNLIPVSLGSLVLISIAGAAEVPAFRQQEAHQHGQATLDIVLEGKVVTVEMEIPALILLGFEHAPATAQELALVEQLRLQLAQPDKLLEFAGLACSADNSTDYFSLGEHDHAGEAHEVETHEEPGHEEHADIHLRYVLACEGPPSAARVVAFTEYPALEAVQVQWISDNGQGGGVLRPASPRISFAE